MAIFNLSSFYIKDLLLLRITMITLTLVLIGLFLATGKAGRLSFLAVGNPLIADFSLISGSGLLVLTEVGTPSDIRVRLRSSVGLAEGMKLLVSLGGDILSLLLSPPILNFLQKITTIV